MLHLMTIKEKGILKVLTYLILSKRQVYIDMFISICLYTDVANLLLYCTQVKKLKNILICVGHVE